MTLPGKGDTPADDDRQVIVCPYCDNGTIVNRDGEGREVSRWRCHACRGSARIYAETERAA